MLPDSEAVKANDFYYKELERIGIRTANEIAIAAKFGWESVLIGPRVLRTETAGLVAATLANAASGDMKFY